MREGEKERRKGGRMKGGGRRVGWTHLRVKLLAIYGIPQARLHIIYTLYMYSC